MNFLERQERIELGELLGQDSIKDIVYLDRSRKNDEKKEKLFEIFPDLEDLLKKLKEIDRPFSLGDFNQSLQEFISKKCYTWRGNVKDNQEIQLHHDFYTFMNMKGRDLEEEKTCDYAVSLLNNARNGFENLIVSKEYFRDLKATFKETKRIIMNQNKEFSGYQKVEDYLPSKYSKNKSFSEYLSERALKGAFGGTMAVISAFEIVDKVYQSLYNTMPIYDPSMFIPTVILPIAGFTVAAIADIQKPAEKYFEEIRKNEPAIINAEKGLAENISKIKDDRYNHIAKEFIDPYKENSYITYGKEKDSFLEKLKTVVKDYVNGFSRSD